MAATDRKKKRATPPTFHFLPKSRAKQLRKSWVQDHKIRSKWWAQKKREGLTSPLVEHSPRHQHVDPDPVSDTNRQDSPPTPVPAPSHGKQSLRNLRRTAYSSGSFYTQKADSSHRGGRATASQPVMKLRMNVLLEKIKRNLSQ